MTNRNVLPVFFHRASSLHILIIILLFPRLLSFTKPIDGSFVPHKTRKAFEQHLLPDMLQNCNKNFFVFALFMPKSCAFNKWNERRDSFFLLHFKTTLNCYRERKKTNNHANVFSCTYCEEEKYAYEKWTTVSGNECTCIRADLIYRVVCELLSFFPLQDAAILVFSWRVWSERVPLMWSAFTSYTVLIWPAMLSLPGSDLSSVAGNMLNFTTRKILPWVHHHFFLISYSV